MRGLQTVTLLVCLGAALPVVGQANRAGRRDPAGTATNAEIPDNENGVSPARQIRRQPSPRPPATLGGPVRSIDGTGNNLDDPDMGAAVTALRRLVAAEYGDGISSLAGADRPTARLISNTVCAQDESRENPLGASDYLWQWG